MKLILLCLGGGALAMAGCGGGGAGNGAAAAARPTAAPPVEIALKTEHRSGVTGTATLAPDGDMLNITLRLDKPVSGRLMAHVHTGPCSDEPTAANPRIWALLHDVVGGRSRTPVNVVTLKELQSEPASINVHDPTHGNRPLVCGDIPRAG
jgi:hypothetical protein